MRKKTSSSFGREDSSLSESGVVVPSPAPESIALLNAFHAISANAVYTMAPKESVVRGYEYYRQQRLHHYVWSQGRTTLTARVEGTKLYSVVFSLADEFLDASCDCPAWDPVWLCKHVLCACFMTKLSFHRRCLVCRPGNKRGCLSSEPSCSAAFRNQS